MTLCTLLRPLAALALTVSTLAAAQTPAWPSRPVKIVVPYPPGGAVDVVTRKMAARLQQQTGQTFFVENKAGAAGTVGLMSVVQVPADGHTLAANDTSHALLPHIFRKLPFDHASALVPVGAFVFAPMTVAVRADSPHRTLADLVAAGKARADAVTYGTGGAGSAPHFVSEALGIAAGANFMHVPFKGAGEATMAMLSGTIDFQVASTPGILGQVRGGKVRLLAVSGTRRAAALPEVPTFQEAGVKFPGLINFTGLFAPRGTPPAVLERLHKEIAVAMASPDMKAYAESIGAEPGHWDAAEFARDLHERGVFWGRIAANTAFERQ